MNAVTYSNENVINFLNNEIIPIQVLFDFQPLATQYNLQWTPTIIILDGEGKEHQRTVGFFPPEEFIPSIILGIGKAYFELGQFEDAIKRFENILKDYQTSKAAPEALYLLGVSKYKNTHEPKHLKEAYNLLKQNYPDSEWTGRAEPYSLL